MDALRDLTVEPRLKAGLWAAAFVRRCSALGAFAAISRRGDESAGTIFIEVLHRDGADLYAPAPGEASRKFEQVMQAASPADVLERIEKEASFDRDLWVITVEDRDGRTFLEPSERV